MLCICGHPEEDHEKGWAMCDGITKDGELCKCVMFEEYEPEADDDEYDPCDDDELISSFKWPSEEEDDNKT